MRISVIVLVVSCFLVHFLTVQADNKVSKFIDDTINEHPVVIFSKSYCPYCKRAKQTFAKLNVTPYVVELDERDDGAEIQNALSIIIHRRTVPQVFIAGKHLGGSDDTVAAYENGMLEEMIENASNQEL